MHKYELILSFALLAFILPYSGIAQEMAVIELRNPSFEDYPKAGTDGGKAPSGWFDCGKPGETAPDIHPAQPPQDYFFSVKTPAFEGKTYVGMVARANETNEAIGQRLRKPLERGKAYNFGLHLSQSPDYESSSKGDTLKHNHNTPLKVRIWGGNGFCKKDELLDESPMINHADWRQYQFRFEPKKNHSFIYLEVFWKTPSLKPAYRGNVLIDNGTPIFEVPIDQPNAPLPGVTEAPIVKILNPQQSGRKSQDNTFLVEATIENMTAKNGITFLVNGKTNKFSFDPAKGNFKSNILLLKGNNKFRIKASNASGTHQDEAIVVYTPKEAIVAAPPPRNPEPPVKQAYTLNPELEEKLETGQKLRISNLRFAADSYVIEKEAFAALDEFANYLLVNTSVKIEVGGHTNDRCEDKYCNRLSENRAQAVASYLKGKGIGEHRIVYKGYGKTQPIYGNRYEHLVEKNQRVEIKIL